MMALKLLLPSFHTSVTVKPELHFTCCLLISFYADVVIRIREIVKAYVRRASQDSRTSCLSMQVDSSIQMCWSVHEVFSLGNRSVRLVVWWIVSLSRLISESTVYRLNPSPIIWVTVMQAWRLLMHGRRVWTGPWLVHWQTCIIMGLKWFFPSDVRGWFFPLFSLLSEGRLFHWLCPLKKSVPYYRSLVFPHT